MDHLSYITEYIESSISCKQRLLQDTNILKKIQIASETLTNVYRNGGKVLIAGNGGSAADAQHIAAEFVSRFFFDRPGLPAIAITTDTSMLTAIGNDYGFENLFARQVQAQGQSGDVFIGISTSGNSTNILKALEVAKEKGILTIVLCGELGVMKDIADISICVPSKITPYIQESHIAIGHILCAIVEKEIFG